MARPHTPKVGHLVTYWTASGKPQPARITVAGATPTIRVLGTNTPIATLAVGPRDGGKTVRQSKWEPR